MPAQLQRLVRARGMNNMVVMNCGVPGYTTAEMLAAAHFRDLRVGAQIVVIDYDFEDAVPRTLPGYRTDYAHARKTFRFGAPTFPASLLTTTLTRGVDPLGSGAPLLALRDGEPPSLRDSRVTRPGPFATYRNLRSLVDLARATPGVERVILVRAVAPNGEPGFVAVAQDWNDAAKQIAKETRASVVDPGELTGCCVPGSYLPNREGNARRADAVLKAIRGE